MPQFINRHRVVGNLNPNPNMPWSVAVNRLKNSFNCTTCHIDTTRVTRDLFAAELDLCDPTVDTVIITDEKWKYPDDDGTNYYEETLLAHTGMQNKDIIIVTHRYTNRQVGHRCWLVSYPAFFLIGRFYSPNTWAFKPRDLVNGFSSLNYRPAVHRVLLGYRLYEQGLLDDVIFSLSDQGSFDARIFTQLPEFNKFRQLLPIQCYDSATNDHTVNHPAYSHAYCNIVTETETDVVIDINPGTNLIEHEIITEKSYKPFLGCQVPLFLASRGHYAYLKRLGFETMEDLVPPGYDLMPTVDKVAAIVDVVAQGREYIRDFYFNHLREIEHNYRLATSGAVEQRLLRDIQQLIFR